MNLPAVRMRSVLWILSWLSGIAPLAAQIDFNTRLWQTDDGLPNNIVQAIAQTQDGYLWVGTREGVAQFDGRQFRGLNLVPESSQPSIACLHASRAGDLWIGTEGFGIFCLSHGKVTAPGVADGNQKFDVDQILEAGDGSIWFVTTRGILRWSNQKLEQVAPARGRTARLCVDNTGGIWALDGGLKRLDSLTTTNYSLLAGTLPRTGRSLYCDETGVFWIGTDFGVDNALIKVEDGVAHSFRRRAGPAGFVSVTFRDSHGELWVGSYAGLSRFLNGTFASFRVADEPSYRIYSIFEDQEHNLWIGSEEGLTRLTPKRFRTITKADGLSLNTIVSVCPSQDGGVWIGTWGGGLDHCLNGQITHLTQANGLKSDFVMGITESRDGRLWAGVDYDGPLHSIRNGEVLAYGREQGFVSGVATVALFESTAGVLWIGTRDGLNTWDGSKFTRFTTTNGLCNNWINAICEGTHGAMWIGTSEGMTRWSNGEFENLAARNPRLRVPILSLYQDAQGILWIGTKRRGLLQWRDGDIKEFTRESGLFSDAIYGILEDNHTNLWFNSSRGIFRVNKQQIESFAAGSEDSVTSINYGKADGILAGGQYSEVTQPAACKDTLGRLWFRTTQGVVMVDPEVIAINHASPPVMIEEILADGKRLTGNEFGGRISGRVTIAPGRGELEIHYAALSYSAPEKNLYRYKLEGADSTWINAGNNTVAKYNHLRPGRYRFQVIACNNDGIWNERGQSVECYLEPHFWQTWWFVFLCSLGAVGFVAGSARYVTRLRMRGELFRLEQQHAVERERARIARDMHDELGSKLTQISFQGSIAKRSVHDPVETERQIEQMSVSARAAVSSLQEIVWAADPENDTLEGLLGHIIQYGAQFFGASAVHYEVIAPENIPDRQIAAVVRHNLFLAVKEAINNAAKHACATRVWIRLSVRAAELEILISDNGSGFGSARPNDGSHDKSRRTGYGLANMQERLHAIGGCCEINSEVGQGTTVRFLLPLDPAGK